MSFENGVRRVLTRAPAGYQSSMSVDGMGTRMRLDGSLGVLVTVGLSLAACHEQELGFSADENTATNGTSTTGASTNEDGASVGGNSSTGGVTTGKTGTATTTTAATSSGGSGGSGDTGDATTESTGAGGSPETPECSLSSGRRLFAGYFASCVLDDAGMPRCFGRDEWAAPTTTAPVVDLAINQEGACALQEDCAIKCWGGEGMLATAAPSGAFKAIATAEFGAFCAIDVDQRVHCWGPPAASAQPPSDELYAIAGGERGVFCGLDADKGAVCWDSSSGVPIPAARGPFALLAPADHVCGLAVDGSLSCWGNDYYGATSPPDGKFTSLVSNHVHSCALDEDGEAACWGQLYFNEESPDVIAPPAEAFTTIVTGLAHACGLAPDGSATCWGYGTPDRNNGTLPDLGQASPPEGSFVEIAAGYWHTCALTADGTVACWGDAGL